jgi:hypothetical protein
VAPAWQLNLAQTALAATLALVPTQGPQIDLSEILAPPPTADYSPVQESATLDGPFDAKRYAGWLAASAAGGSLLASEFEDAGFKRGFARSWVAISPNKPQEGFSRRNYLIETVEEYSNDVGAQWRFNGVVNFTKGTDGGLVREIDTASIAGSYGAVADLSYYYFVMFARGNDVYIVRMESSVDDMTRAIVSQAQKQFFLAPPFTIPPAQWTTAQTASIPTASTSIPISTAIFVLLMTAALTGLVFVLVRGRRRSG